MTTFNSDFIDLKSNLKQMLLKGVNPFEDGFTILDVDLEINENLTIDMLAKDAKNEFCIIIFSDNLEESDLINSILETLCQIRKNRFLFKRLYKEHEFDFNIPPRTFVISTRFSDEFIEKLDFIMADEIIAYEYFNLKVEDKEYLGFKLRDCEGNNEIRTVPLLEPLDGPGLKKDKKQDNESTVTRDDTVLTASPAQSSKDTKKKTQKTPTVSAPVPYDKFFHEAKKKIIRISNDIEESVDGVHSRFKIKDQVLVTLSKENNKLSIFLGDTNEKQMEVSSEEKLNEVLNLIFKRYFTAFSSIAKA